MRKSDINRAAVNVDIMTLRLGPGISAFNAEDEFGHRNIFEAHLVDSSLHVDGKVKSGKRWHRGVGSTIASGEDFIFTLK